MSSYSTTKEKEAFKTPARCSITRHPSLLCEESPECVEQEITNSIFAGVTVSSSHCSIRGAVYSHCITFTSFPRGIHRPLVGAFARKLRASSFPGSAGIQSSGLSSCSCNSNGHYRVQNPRFLSNLLGMHER